MIKTKTSERAPTRAAAPRAQLATHDGPTLEPPHYGIELADRPNPGRTAAATTRGAGGPLPFLDRIQPSFGAHDLSDVRAHSGPRAAASAAALNAHAFTSGDHIVLGAEPSLALVAHEAAHVVQQRHGVHVPGGIGSEGDHHERQADAIASRVLRGEPATDLLPAPLASPAPPPAAAVVQRKIKKPASSLSSAAASASADEYYDSVAAAVTALLAAYPILQRFVAADEAALARVTHIVGAMHGSGDHSLAEVAMLVTPNLLVGEAHTDPAARAFIIESLPQLVALGIRDLVVELADGPEPYGDSVRGAVEALFGGDEGVLAAFDKVIKANDTFNQVINAMASTPELHAVLRRYLGFIGSLGGGRGHADSFAELMIAAAKAGFTIHCGDNIPASSNPISKETLAIRDASFATTIATLGRRSITLVGAHHLSDRDKGDSIPSLLAAKPVAAWSMSLAGGGQRGKGSIRRFDSKASFDAPAKSDDTAKLDKAKLEAPSKSGSSQAEVVAPPPPPANPPADALIGMHGRFRFDATAGPLDTRMYTVTLVSDERAHRVAADPVFRVVLGLIANDLPASAQADGLYTEVGGRGPHARELLAAVLVDLQDAVP